MKQFFIFIALIIYLTCNAKGSAFGFFITPPDNDWVVKDTIIIINNKIAHEPFEFQYFSISMWEMKTRLLPLNYSINKIVSPYLYDTTKIDTSYLFSNGRSILTYHKMDCGFITNAVIMDNSIKLKDNIRIGDGYDFVLKKLAPQRVNRVSSERIIICNDDGALIRIILTFRNGRLFSWEFIPYTG